MVYLKQIICIQPYIDLTRLMNSVKTADLRIKLKPHLNEKVKIILRQEYYLKINLFKLDGGRNDQDKCFLL